MNDKIYAYWLSAVPGMGCRRISYLLSRFGSPREIFLAKSEQLEECRCKTLRRDDIDRLIHSRNIEEIQWDYEQLQKKGIQFVTRDEEMYPERLRHIADAPYSLFYRGRLPGADQPAVAVVGSRSATYLGYRTATAFGRELAENGIAVISGLARGVDIASQRGVLTVAGGKTFGILGCGIDICYPGEHIESYMEIQQQGGILSEYPPGTKPRPGLFPLRNRIISGLSDGILVIEAGEKSGSLITAELGLEQGKDIFVVPGALGDAAYAGSNQLIKAGAALVTETRDVLDALGLFYDEDVSVRKKKNEVMLETAEKKVYSVVGLEPVHISEFVRMTGFSVSRLTELLLSMELKGVIRQIGNQYYVIV